jgi:hypothetical protein
MVERTTEHRLRRLEAQFDISQLAYRYATAVDMKDPDLMLSLFADAGRDFESPTLGLREIRSYAESRWQGVGASILFVGNHVIDIDTDGDGATGIVYCLARFAEDGQWIEQAIRYDDRYLRTSNGWRFLTRRHLLWYGQVQTTNPMSQPAANWPQSSVGRGTLPDEWPSWRESLER